MRTCRAMLACVLLIAFLSGCSLIVFLFDVMVYARDFRADITVGDLAAYIHWNEAPAYTLEYAWGVLVDMDANAATGDPEGFDMYVQVSHTSDGMGAKEGVLADALASTADSAPFGVDCFDWEDGGWGWPYTASFSVSGNTIIVFFDYQGAMERAAGFRTRFFTLYFPPPAGPAVSDETSIVTGSASTTDADGDAGGYTFIDIVSARISYIPP
jgi:hypothetical protein